MRVRVRARREDYRYFHIPFFTLLLSPLPSVEKNDTSFSSKQHVSFNKTTRRFQQNNTSFSAKQHVIFSKTTRHFQQNNTSFSVKQHVIFSKTTRHFQQNNTSFSTKQRVVFREKCRNGQRGAEKESTQAQTIFFHTVREILQIGFEAQKHTLHLGRILTGKIMFQIGISGFVVEA